MDPVPPHPLSGLEILPAIQLGKPLGAAANGIRLEKPAGFAQKWVHPKVLTVCIRTLGHPCNRQISKDTQDWSHCETPSLAFV